MRLPALIRTIDATHCSLNCQLMDMGCCTARGDDPNQREALKRDTSTHFCRTEYCTRKASSHHVKIETCPKCGGTCEGETYSSRTKCTRCGVEFVRIEDQDEYYLQEDRGYLRSGA